jgi:prevent-host-death family protein
MYYDVIVTGFARLPVRELRNHVSDVLRRVEAGERFEITVNDRPVAMLVPRGERPRVLPTAAFLASTPQADAALAVELQDELTDTTEDLPDPWLR